MRGTTITVDLDGCLGDFTTPATTVLNRVLKKDVKPHEVRDYKIAPAYGISFEEWVRIHNENMDEIYRPMKPMPGAAEALKRLGEMGHRVVIVSARPGEIRGLTETWLRKWGFAVNKLIMGIEHKLQTCLNERSILHIDDSPDVIKQMQGKIPVVVFDQAYNRDVHCARVHRWEEVPERLEAIRTSGI